jgi:organic hydroperoxide reductase OsmC/OhrA
MAEHAYLANIHWQRGSALFTDNRFSRAHTWRFDGGLEVPASSSPQVLREPFSVAAAVDPEEAFVAALSSCHMLWFLSLAAREGWCIDEYRDAAAGTMGKNAAGKLAVLQVILQPQVSASGERRAARADLERLHHRAHEECFIANSVITQLLCEPRFDA